jgi:leucyl-tRNA synthetase
MGSSKNSVWDEIKNDFDYWYPVDINLGGKEHKTVHFPVFLMNHVAIMPTSKRPQGIFVHWWVTQQGKEKISKSKGGAAHIAEAATTYGVDAMRLYYSHVGSPFVDIEWDPVSVTKYKNRIANIWKMMDQISKIKDKKDENLDKWLKSTLQRTIKKTTDAFEKFDLRVATNEIFFECQKNIQWYIKRGGGNKKLLDYFTKTWTILMTPVTPHLSEELWHQKASSLVTNEPYPKFDSKEISEKDEIGEYLLSSVTDDVSEILKVTKIKPKKICIYTSPSWKIEVYKKAISSEDKINVGAMMKEIMQDAAMKQKAKEVSQFVGKLPGEIMKLNENDKKRYLTKIDETEYLVKSKDYLKQVFSCAIEIYNADKKDIYDPANKTRYAIPLRPAIYIE